MALGPVRPRFQLQLSIDPDVALARIEEAVRAVPQRAVCRVLDGHIDIAIARPIRHRFSPCLQLEFNVTSPESAAPGVDSATRTIVHGLVGPHPNLWTLYAFTGLGCVTLLLFCGIFGGAQVALQESAWGFWGVPLGAAGLAGLYVVSQFGQRRSAEQTAFLHALVHDALSGVEIAATPRSAPDSMHGGP